MALLKVSNVKESIEKASLQLHPTYLLFWSIIMITCCMKALIDGAATIYQTEESKEREREERAPL